MNYVRKLGFEETPDYDFLRELFTKVLKTLGEPEDGVFDWMLLNNGKGWEASNVCHTVLSARGFHINLSSTSRARTTLLKLMLMQHLLMLIASIGETATTVTDDRAKMQTPILHHLSSSVRHQRTSRAVAGDPLLKREPTPPVTSVVFSLLPQQVDGRANSNGKQVLSQASASPLIRMPLLPAQTDTVLEQGASTDDIHRTRMDWPISIPTVPSHSCTTKVKERTGLTLGMERQLAALVRGICMDLRVLEEWLCTIAIRWLELGSKTRI